MGSVSVLRLAAIAAATVFSATLLVACAAALPTTDTANTPKARVEGVYVLLEWHIDGEVFRPPQVEGRFLVTNGEALTVLHNRSKEANQTTAVLIGGYTLDATHFSYSYPETSVFVQTPSAITVSPKPLWEGIRTFALTADGNAVRLRADNGKYEMVFTTDGLTYSKDGKVVRVWRRAEKH